MNQPQRLRRLLERVAFVGVVATDPDELRVQKVSLTLAAVTVTLLAVVWVGTYLALGLPVSAAIPFAYQVVSIVSLAWFGRTKDYRLFRASQLVLIIAPAVPAPVEPRRLRGLERGQPVGAGRGARGPVLLQPSARRSRGSWRSSG